MTYLLTEDYIQILVTGNLLLTNIYIEILVSRRCSSAIKHFPVRPAYLRPCESQWEAKIQPYCFAMTSAGKRWRRHRGKQALFIKHCQSSKYRQVKVTVPRSLLTSPGLRSEPYPLRILGSVDRWRAFQTGCKERSCVGFPYYEGAQEERFLH